MSEKKNGDFSKKAKGKLEALGSKAGQMFRNVKEQAAPVAEKVTQQVKSTSKKAADAIGDKIKDVKTAAEQIRRGKPTVIHFPGSDIRILFPDGYERQKPKKTSRTAAEIDDLPIVCRKKTGSSENTVQVFRTSREDAAGHSEVRGEIDRLHEGIAEDQGIIEVKSGICADGRSYMYSIVKTAFPEQLGGLCYTLRAVVCSETDAVGILGNFRETGTVGERETVGMELARRAGLISVFGGGSRAWECDPYDPGFRRGRLKTLAEKEGLDVLFPDNPLSQAHEFLLAALENKFVAAEPESAAQPAEESGAEAAEDAKAESEKERLLGLFSDECRRSTYPVSAEEQEETPEEASEAPTADGEWTRPEVKPVSTRSAVKVIYYLMAADGEVFHSEEEKFDSVGAELSPSFAEIKEQVVAECKAQMEKGIDPEDYYDVLQDGVEMALAESVQTEDSFITPKLLVWDLLTVAYSDESYDEAERKLLKYVVRKLDIDKAAFLEMENSILTLADLEKELNWIKTTDRPYLVIESMVNEIADRKNVIFESVKDLIAL